MSLDSMDPIASSLLAENQRLRAALDEIHREAGRGFTAIASRKRGAMDALYRIEEIAGQAIAPGQLSDA